MIWWKSKALGGRFMISVVIPTHESERALAHTLAALVAGALDGILREVIVADAGSTDGTAMVADVAGCRFLVLPGERGARLAAAAATARAEWLWFVRPGSIPGTNWIEELGRFIRECDLASDNERAAVFRARPVHDRSARSEVLALLREALGARPNPSQGLLIPKPLYRTAGGYKTDAADPETDLLRRLGRRRIVTLDVAMTSPMLD
ncbi:MAG: glycosyltransferase [Rhizobiales bacterium]|nr:glycosyltransferase [Hyphomicrobiales bacterium]